MFINATIQTFLLHTFRQTLLAAIRERDAKLASQEPATAYRFGAERVSLTKSSGFPGLRNRIDESDDPKAPPRLPGQMQAVVVRAADLKGSTASFHTYQPQFVSAAAKIGEQFRVTAPFASLLQIATTECAADVKFP